MTRPKDVSILRQTYLLSVVFIQLSLVGDLRAAMAQGLNPQTQIDITAPPAPMPSPDLSVGRPSQQNTRRPAQAHHTARRQHKNQ
jgi:hypothetical protein